MGAQSTHQQVIIRMPRELHDAIQERAEDEERSVAGLIRYALKCYLAEDEEGTNGG